MKISHQFLKNLSSNILLGVLLCTPTLFLSKKAYTKGLFQTFEEIADIQKTNYDKYLDKLVRFGLDFESIKDVKEVKLHSSFINTILFNSPGRYILAGTKDKCALYDLMSTDLLKGTSGSLKHIIITYKNFSNKVKTAAIKREAFLQKIAYIQCPSVANLRKHFDTKNIKATIKSISLETPQSHNQCLKIHDSFIADYKTPYLCSMIENIRSLPKLRRQLNRTPKKNTSLHTYLKGQIKKANGYSKLLSSDAKDYLEHLCLNISYPENFCKSFFEINFWKRASTNQNDKMVFKTFCKKAKSVKHLKLCAQQLSKDKEICRYTEGKSQSLSPKPNCKEISRALNFSRLFRKYTDCPAQSSNDAITTFSRYFNHMKGASPKSPSSCEVNSTLPFAEFATEYLPTSKAVAKICYQFELTANTKCLAIDGGLSSEEKCISENNKSEICLPVIYGNSLKRSPLAITSVFEKILSKRKGFTQKCHVISKKEFKPQLLKFKSGCYIVTDTRHCMGLACTFKVLLDEIEFKDYTIDKEVKFDFTPSNFINREQSITANIFKALDKKSHSVKNISEIKAVLNKNKKNIILGIGCAEDLLPSFKKSKYINQCTPLPFIIDGIIEKNGSYALITRTSLDHIHAPRIIPWSYIFSSLRSYQNQTPLHTWGLYAPQ